MSGPSARLACEAAIEAVGFPTRIDHVEDLSGGCMHSVRRLDLSDGTQVVVKIGAASDHGLFEEEETSLRALAATNTVQVPTVHGVVVHERHTVLLQSWLPAVGAARVPWASFGEQLAALHGIDGHLRYGFEIDNHLGRTPQENPWHEDWVEFNREARFGPQLQRAAEARLLRDDESRTLFGVVDRLDRLLPRHPHPALLHGDLWSGNAIPTRDAAGEPCVAVIDPACSVGDGWADIAMMRLFGGFPGACFEAYAAHVEDQDCIETRIAVYQLYHVLNHVNLFGRGYVGQALALAARLT